MGLNNPQPGYPSQGFGGKGSPQQQVGYQPANRATGAPAYLAPSVQALQSALQPTGFGGKGPPQELPPQPRLPQSRLAPQRQYRV